MSTAINNGPTVWPASEEAVDAMASAFRKIIEDASDQDGARALAAALKTAGHGNAGDEFYRRQVAGYLFTVTAGRVDLTGDLADHADATTGDRSASDHEADAGLGGAICASPRTTGCHRRADAGLGGAITSEASSGEVAPVDDDGETTIITSAEKTDGPASGEVTVRASYSETYSTVDMFFPDYLTVSAGDANAEVMGPTPTVRFDHTVLSVLPMASPSDDESEKSDMTPKEIQTRTIVEEAYFYDDGDMVALSEHVPAPVATPGKIVDFLAHGADVKWIWAGENGEPASMLETDPSSHRKA